MKINVTKKEIKVGLRLQGERCPVALALYKKGFKKVHVGNFNVEMWSCPVGEIDWNHVTFQLPKKVTKFVTDFDCGHRVKPISFRLPLTKAELYGILK